MAHSTKWAKKWRILPFVHRQTCPYSFYIIHMSPTRWSQLQMQPYSNRFAFAFYSGRISNFQNFFRAFHASQINYPERNLYLDFKILHNRTVIRLCRPSGPDMMSEIHSERKLFGADFIKTIKYNSKLLSGIDTFMKLGIHCLWNIFYHEIKYYRKQGSMNHSQTENLTLGPIGSGQWAPVRDSLIERSVPDSPE